MPEVLERQEELLTEQEKRQLAIQSFRPPAIKAGRFVQWFRDADRSIQGYRALVLSVGERAVHLQVLNQDTPWLVNSVHHIDDPELKERKGLRKYGAWDFAPEDKEVAEKLEALEKLIEQKDRVHSERIAALGRRLESLEQQLGVKNVDDEITQAAKRGREADGRRD